MTPVYAGTAADFDDDVRLGVLIDGREVFVFRHQDQYYAFENRCVHAGGPVGEGTVIGRVRTVLNEHKEAIREEFSDTDFNIVCPWHGYEYSIETGQCIADPRLSLRRYAVDVRPDGVYVS